MNQSRLLRLMMLMSPSFPIGGFAYSAGLEQAVADGRVNNAATLQGWLDTVLQSGPVWNDAVLLCTACRHADDADLLSETSSLATALAGSKERHLETHNLGNAFMKAVKASGLPCPQLPLAITYPVAVGAVAASSGIDPETAVVAFLHAFVSNQMQCAIRLSVLGQNGGVAMLAAFEGLIAEIGARAAGSALDDLGTNTLIADISSMRHEALYSRIFRT